MPKKTSSKPKRHRKTQKGSRALAVVDDKPDATTLAVMRTALRYRTMMTAIVSLAVIGVFVVLYFMLGLVEWDTTTSLDVSIVSKVGFSAAASLAVGGGAGALYGGREKKRSDRLSDRNRVLEGRVGTLQQEVDQFEKYTKRLEAELDRRPELGA